ELSHLQDQGKDQFTGLGTQYHDLMLRMGEAAEAYARQNNLGIPEYRGLLANGLELCRLLRVACGTPYEGRERFDVWTHKRIVYNNLKRIEAHGIDQASLEQCVG